MKKEGLRRMLMPQSVAVVGASERRDSVGYAVFANILRGNFQGILFPIHPKRKSILSVKAYSSVLSVRDTIDMAVIITPSQVVPKVVQECAQKGIRSCVVITAGFKEIGEDGQKLERAMLQTVQKEKLTLVGPNCLGVINTSPAVSLNASFASSFPKAGNVAFVSQSGAVGVAALEYASKQDFGFSKFVSIGNKADVHENHILRFLADDPETKVILLYLENLAEPREFAKICREITTTSGKPIIAIKSGRTREGQKAASSHTGALAGSDEVYDKLFLQCGVVRVETMEELFDYALAFANQPLPKGNGIAIVSNAGGPGILTTDACIRHGLRLASFSAETEKQLKKVLPVTANIHNPVDLIGDADATRYEGALKAVLKEREVNGVIVICTPQLMTPLEKVAKTVTKLARKQRKPVLCSFMSLAEEEELAPIFDAVDVPNYPFPESAARAMGHLARYGAWIHRPLTEVKQYRVHRTKAKNILRRAAQENRKVLLESEAYQIFRAYGLPTPEYQTATSVKEAKAKARKIGFPVVLKVSSPQIIHKVDAGAVRLHLKSEQEVEQAFSEMKRDIHSRFPKAEIREFLVAKFYEGGVETIMGIHRDPHFGPVLMFGLGGIFVEVFKDVTFRIAPIRELSAARMIQEIQGFKILQGMRTGIRSDIQSIQQALQRLSQLAQDLPAIAELDINPLKVYQEGEGAIMVDARILLG